MQPHGSKGTFGRTAELASFEGKNIGLQKAPPLFGQMFPSLAGDPLKVPDADLKALADSMKDSGDPTGDNPDLPAGFTYLGQFVDHDLTLDTSGFGEALDDPLSVENFRTPALDLDCLYGGGPDRSNYLFDRADPAKFLIGNTTPAGGIGAMPNDLPRNAQTFALIGDHRNDENLLVAQTHLAFLKFHNKVVDLLRSVPGAPGDGKTLFLEARRIVTWHYQWIVLFDFVERITEKGIVAKIRRDGRKFYRFKTRPFMPIEFSVAAYRLGHSMVRQEYSHNKVFNPTGFNLLFKFSGLSGDMNGKPTLPSNWIIDWRRFFELLPPPDGKINLSRMLDPFLAPELHNLPGGGGSLPFRNLKRGVEKKLPSGQAVAEYMRKHVGVAPMTPEEIASGPDGAVAKARGLHEKTPLWYYVLKEALVKGGGKRLGPYGARIVAEVFVGIVQGDKDSFMSEKNAPKDWNPSKEKHPLKAAISGHFTMADLLTFVDDINPIGD